MTKLAGELDRRGAGAAWIVGFAVIGVAVASFALGSADVRMRSPRVAEPSPLTELSVVAWIWVAAAVTVPLWSWSAGRFPINSRHWFRGLLVHTVLALVCSGLTTAVVWVVHEGGLSLPPVSLERIGAWSLPFWLVIGALHVIEGRRRLMSRQLETERLRAQLAETRNQLLSAKLQPHFLFNTLQAISTLIHRDPSSADRMLGSLSDLLREFLTREPHARHRLSEELDLLYRYMEISSMRIGERLQFRREVDAGLEDLLVPVLLLQPLAENAIEYGVARNTGPGCVTVFAHREGASLCFGIADDGPGQAPGAAPVEGVGLGNSRSRLQSLYGDRATLELIRIEPHGLRVAVRIPLDASAEEPL